MESVYPANRYTCTEKLTKLEEHFDGFSKECYGEDYAAFNGNETIEDTFSKLFGDVFNVEKLKKMAEDCSIENLTVPDEYRPIDISTYNKHTVRLQKPIPDTAKGLSTVQAKIHWDKKSKMKPRDAENITLIHDFSKTIDFLPGSEILITVRVYHPFPRLSTQKVRYDYRFGLFRCSHEIVALGSHSLKDLREKILCRNDNGSSIEVEDISQPVPENIKDDFSSSLICLDNKLYIDMSPPNPVDYSIVIKQWAKEKDFKENFITEHMENVKLSELNFRLGYPYIFQHRGDCEHIFVFSDIKLAKTSDSLCRDDYPFYNTINRYNVQHCGFCKKIFSQWLCIGSNRLVHAQTVLCNECLVSYNYINGEKIGDFKVYPYNNKSFIGL